MCVCVDLCIACISSSVHTCARPVVAAAPESQLARTSHEPSMRVELETFDPVHISLYSSPNGNLVTQRYGHARNRFEIATNAKIQTSTYIDLHIVPYNYCIINNNDNTNNGKNVLGTVYEPTTIRTNVYVCVFDDIGDAQVNARWRCVNRGGWHDFFSGTPFFLL